MKRKILFLLTLLSVNFAFCQEQKEVKLFPYGDFEKWITRTVTDSKILGGNSQTLHEISYNQDVPENTPFVKNSDVPWRTSNVYASVGVDKGSSTVYSEKRGDGFCARLETKLEKVRVLGLFNINVIAAGSVYLGDLIEPIESMKEAISNVIRGAKMDERPEKIIFDYKYHSAGERYYANGLKSPKKIGGINNGEVVLFIQKRWEDNYGNILAERIGTATVMLKDTDGEWVNKYELEIEYGDISQSDSYTDVVKLLTSSTPKDFQHYAINSKGQSVPIIEVGWGSKEDTPTHIFLTFSSSQSGAFVGAPGSKLWIDNVSMGF